MRMRGPVHFGNIALLALVVASLNAMAADEHPGVLWESTTQNVMEGMPMQMPAQTVKVCTAKEWSHPPAGGNPDCTSSDYKRVGATATWTVRCTGQMAMTGTGEVTFTGDDAYAGTIKFATSQMNMTIKLSGRKVGACDNPQ
jgi:uncharacterized protein DUF3617